MKALIHFIETYIGQVLIFSVLIWCFGVELSIINLLLIFSFTLILDLYFYQKKEFLVLLTFAFSIVLSPLYLLDWNLKINWAHITTLLVPSIVIIMTIGTKIISKNL